MFFFLYVSAWGSVGHTPWCSISPKLVWGALSDLCVHSVYFSFHEDWCFFCWLQRRHYRLFHDTPHLSQIIKIWHVKCYSQMFIQTGFSFGGNSSLQSEILFQIITLQGTTCVANTFPNFRHLSTNNPNKHTCCSKLLGSLCCKDSKRR